MRQKGKIMKEKVKLIQGNPDRAEEIRKTLEEWGGINIYKLKCIEDSQYYFIDNLYTICSIRNDSYVQKLISEGKAEIYKLPQPKHQFQAFEKVLVRDNDCDKWRCGIFSHMLNDGGYCCIAGAWNQCIPYESNEHLLGTINKPE